MKLKLTKQKLRLTKKRLKTTKSNDLRKKIEKIICIELFLKKIESAQMRLNELQRLTENVKCELKSYSRWWQAKRMKWDEFSEEEKRRIRLERESAEFQNQDKKYDELRKKEYETEFARHKIKEKLKFAEQELKIAQLNNLREIVERVVLIKMTQKKLQFAQIQFEKKSESTAKIELKKKIINEVNSISCIKKKMKRLWVYLNSWHATSSLWTTLMLELDDEWFLLDDYIVSYIDDSQSLHISDIPLTC
jgi:hypothetical protein